MPEPLIERAEVVALLFNVATSPSRWRASNDSLEGTRTMAKKKLTKAEREERDARHERVLANAQRTRELAEQAQAKLDAQASRE
jgi:tRNA(Ile)-lysidine synthase TilS/MesJ